MSRTRCAFIMVAVLVTGAPAVASISRGGPPTPRLSTPLAAPASAIASPLAPQVRSAMPPFPVDLPSLPDSASPDPSASLPALHDLNDRNGLSLDRQQPWPAHKIVPTIDRVDPWTGEAFVPSPAIEHQNPWGSNVTGPLQKQSVEHVDPWNGQAIQISTVKLTMDSRDPWPDTDTHSF